MINYLRFIPLFFILLIVGSGCKSLKKAGNHSNQLRYMDESNKDAVNISDLIDAKKTTLICVRHAEKQLDVDNPSLTEAGRQRANDLSMLLDNVAVNAIYSSDYNRTIETAQPLSNKTKLPIQRYNPNKLNDLKDTILSSHHNEVVVVVGHSNTTPKLVNKLLSENKYNSFDESDYDNIFIISVDAGSVDNVHLLEYGTKNTSK